jgi:arabinosaccharide transport system substrate-binding protein
VDIKLTDGAALVNRLLAAFIAGKGAPDVTEVEISSIGRFFKGPIEEIGFVDLTDRFRREGYLDAIPAARFTPWMTRGHIFGCPEDLHPVILLYREDLFRRWDGQARTWATIDLPREVKLWSDFERVGQEVMRDAAAHGEPARYPIGLHKNQWWNLWMLLLQRGGGMFDEQGRVIIDQPVAVETLQFVCDLFNRDRIAWTIEDLPSLWAAMKDDKVMSVMAADWFVGFVKDNRPEQAGKWRAMPLPAFEPGGRRVSSHGGTTMAIPKQCPNQEMAWELIKFFYLNHDVVVERVPKTRVMPALKSAYRDPRLLSYEDPFLGKQRIAALFGSLKDDIPRIYQTPYWAEAQALLQQAVFNAVEGYQTPAQALRRVRERLERDVGRYQAIEGHLTAK